MAESEKGRGGTVPEASTISLETCDVRTVQGYRNLSQKWARLISLPACATNSERSEGVEEGEGQLGKRQDTSPCIRAQTIYKANF